MPTALEYAFKEKSTKLLILLPSEPFTFGHFYVRHPVQATTASSCTQPKKGSPGRPL